jgi:hypothetical protein
VTDRSATATIKGYFYQFDQTIVRLLEASKHGSVTVEGIEDIDLEDGDESAFVQCKYYEGTEYNHSVIKEAVIHMLRHFHAKGCPTNQIYRYRLYGHYKSGQQKLALPLTDEFLKNSFLTYTREKVEHKIHEELALTTPQLAAFRALLDIDVNAPSYEDQQAKLVKLLVSAVPECNATDAEVFYYPCAINVVQSLAVQADETRRKTTRERFLKAINRKDVVFSSWLRQKFGAAYYAKSIRRKHFKFTTTKMPRASRIFVIDMDGDFDAHKTVQMLARMSGFFSHKELGRTPPEDRFCPYVLLRGLASSELIELKTGLWKQGVKFNDGYPFQGADFSASSLANVPTKENLWRIKFIPSEDQLAPTIAAITGSIIEIYDLYKGTPLDDSFFPSGFSRHAFKCENSYFIQEVIQA